MRAAALVLVAIAFATGCSSSGDDGGDGGDAPAAVDPALADYCERMDAYAEATSIDTSTMQSTLDGLTAAAAAASAVAEVAPDEVAEAHQLIATAAERLVTRLQEAAPETIDDVIAAGNEITAELEAELGNLDGETQAVTDFAERECS